MKSKITYYNDKVSRTISSVYIKDRKIESIYTENQEFENKAKEIYNLLFNFLSEDDINFLEKNNIPLFELEILYKIVDESIIRYVNFLNIKPNLKDNQELFEQLQYKLMQFQLLVDKKDKIERNELCPCKSGKKYKVCHGKQ